MTNQDTQKGGNFSHRTNRDGNNSPRSKRRSIVVPMPARRGLKLDQSAEYCGMSIEQFRTHMARGLMPQPYTRTGDLDNSHGIWDMKTLDKAMDHLSGIGSDEDPEAWDACLQERGNEDG